MAITLFGTASTPADNGTNTTQITVVTPPSSMQLGDLVWLTGTNHSTSGTVAMSETGGQTWTSLTQVNGTRCRTRNFWCIFNGTWTADPSVNLGGTLNNIVRMLVFRPTNGTSATWEVDVAYVGATYSAPSSPYTVTIPSITTVTAGALVIATWASVDDNAWTNLTGSSHTWTAITPAQVRNTSGTYDGSQSHAWMIDAAAGATGTVSQNQSLGGDTGARAMIAFREVIAPEQHSGSMSVSGGGTAVASGTKGAKSAVSVSAGGSVVAIGIAMMFGAVSVSGGGHFVATGVASAEQHYGSLSVSGGGTVIAIGSKHAIGIVSISGNGGATATGKKDVGGTFFVSGGGSVTITGIKGESGHEGAISVSGGGQFAAIGKKSAMGTASVIVGGALKRWDGAQWVKVKVLTIYKNP